MKKPTVLIIMDGFGLNAPDKGNAIAAAKKPNLDALFAQNPVSKLSASGLDVGLPEGQMGNSEVGHTNIGAGRVVFQDLPKITKSIQDGDFFENKAYKDAMLAAKEAGKAVHIYGLMSNGGVHSHIAHIEAAVKMAHDLGCKKIFVHCFMDGRDVPPTSGKGFVEEMKDLQSEGVGDKSPEERAAAILGVYEMDEATAEIYADAMAPMRPWARRPSTAGITAGL